MDLVNTSTVPTVQTIEQLRNFWVSFMQFAGRNGEKPTGKSHSLQIVVRCTHWPLQCDAKTSIENQGKTFFADCDGGLLTLTERRLFIHN